MYARLISIRTILAVVLFLAAEPAAASVLYSVDDGAAELTTGLTPAGGSVIFANRFSALPGGERINELSIAFGLRGTAGAAKPGTPVELLVFRDRTGGTTPNTPFLLRSAQTTVQNPNTNTFIRVPIDPVDVTGNFFVGVLVSRLPSDGPYPIAFDQSRPQGRSFGAFFTTAITHDRLGIMSYNATRTTASPGNLNTNAFVRAADGNFMIRATGVPVPEPGSLAGFAPLALTALRRRRRVSSANGIRG